MNNLKKAKKIALSLFAICLITLIVYYVKSAFIENKSEETLCKIEKGLEKQENENKDKIDVNQTDIDDIEVIFQDGEIGIIKIPSIGVDAPICEGVSQEVLKYTVRAF